MLTWLIDMWITFVNLDINVTCKWLRTCMTCAWLNVICYYFVNNTWMSYVRTSWNVWSSYWMDDIFMAGWVMYRNVHMELHSVYSWHTYMCYETMHSFLKNKFISFMQMGLQWFYGILVCKQVMEKRIDVSSGNYFQIWGWFTYLQMNLNMWLKRRARMMAACVMVLLRTTVKTGRGGLLVCVTSPTPRAL